MQLNTIKQFNPDIADLESLVEMLAYGNLMLNEFRNLEDSGVEAPEWLEAKVKRIRREVITKAEDVLRKRLADAKLRVEQHKTPNAKLRDAQAEVKRLEALVGKDD